MLLPEQVRLLPKELNLINDAALYTVSSSPWATAHDYGNITLSEAGLLLVRFKNEGSPNASGDGIRLKIGSLYVLGQTKSLGNQFFLNTIVAYPAGTYNVLAEAVGAAGFPGGISNLQIGFVKFSDLITAIHQTNLNTQNLSIATRNWAGGALKEGLLIVTVFAEGDAADETVEFENVGDNFTNGVRIFVDSVQQSWTFRLQDTISGTTRRGASWAIYRQKITVGTTYAIALQRDSVNTNVTYSMILCPWILSDVAIRPVDLSRSPPGSTYYTRLEPLTADPTKNSKIGRPRALPVLGSEFYSTASGTGVLNHSYTLEQEDPTGIDHQADGGGNLDNSTNKQHQLSCISHVAVDVR